MKRILLTLTDGVEPQTVEGLQIEGREEFAIYHMPTYGWRVAIPAIGQTIVDTYFPDQDACISFIEDISDLPIKWAKLKPENAAERTEAFKDKVHEAAKRWSTVHHE